MLRDFLFGNCTMPEKRLRLYYGWLGVTQDGIPGDAMEHIFRVSADRFQEITYIIGRRIDPNPVGDVNNGQQEEVSDLSGAAGGPEAVDLGDNAGEARPQFQRCWPWG
jgi:hypothetical protein